MTVKTLLRSLRTEQLVEFRENNWTVCEMSSRSPAILMYLDRKVKDWFPYVWENKLKVVVNLYHKVEEA